MDSSQKIEEIIAKYWLEENKYCGISAIQILKKMKGFHPNITEEDVKSIILDMEKKGLFSTREIESGDRVTLVWDGNHFVENIDPGPHVDLWVYPNKFLLVKYDNSKVEEVGQRRQAP